MCLRQLRKSLFILLAACLFLEQASGQATSLTKSTTQEQQIKLDRSLEMGTTEAKTSTASSSSGLQKQSSSSSSSAVLDPASTSASDLLNNQEILLDSLETQWTQLTLQLQALETQSDSLEKTNSELEQQLNSSKSTIDSLKSNLESYKQALISNKDDTSYIVGLFADAQKELDDIKTYVAKLEKDKHHLKMARITATATGCLGVGCCILANNMSVDDNIKNLLNGLGIGIAAASGLTLGVSFFF